MQVAPGAPFEAVINWGTAGATLGVKVIDNVGGTTIARTTSGITEVAAGIYAKPFSAAPGTAGQYSVVWDDTVDFVADELVVSGDTASIGGTSNLYVTVAEMKDRLHLSGETFADDWIESAIAAACRVIDAYKNTRFYPTAETRYYTADRWADSITIDALVTLTSVTVDDAGDGSYSTTWVDGTDFYLDPPNAQADGIPTRRLVLRSQAGRYFPPFQRAIKVQGTFGWVATPAQVHEAAAILAERLFKRAETPYALVAVTADVTAAARLGKIDPDVALLLDSIPGASIPLFV